MLGGLGRITGRVLATDGPPPAGLQVGLYQNVYATYAGLIPSAYLMGKASRTMAADAFGGFAFEDVPYGAWCAPSSTKAQEVSTHSLRESSSPAISPTLRSRCVSSGASRSRVESSTNPARV